MAKYLKRQEGIEVSHVFVADLWREHELKPHRQDTVKLSKDPLFAEKVADIVGLYVVPPAAAVVLCVDEKSGVQALDRAQPLLPLTFDKAESERTTTSGMAQSICSVCSMLRQAKSPGNATHDADQKSFSRS